MQREKKGVLYVVATPIGNLEDMTHRAIQVLKKVDRIVAEDTKHSGPLLKHFSISKPTTSLHDFNERERIHSLIESLNAGESIALISDAGTPLISDPGYHLVKEAQLNQIKVIPIPGACAAIAALSAAGLPTDKFIFEGFLPPKEEARRNRLTSFIKESRTIIFYEAPHRLLSCLKTMLQVFGEARMAVVARELTKIYESILARNLAELVQYYESHTDEQKGEIVILLAGCDKQDELQEETHKVLQILLEELPLKQAVSLASKITHVRKNVLYEIALVQKKSE